ncbi:MAG: type IV pilus twitching motility protein PilT [Myxococcales bacterium]
MKRLDKFLEVLFLRGAAALVLRTGAAAYLEGPPGQTRALMQRTLSNAQIVSAIAELMPPYMAEAFSGADGEEFEYLAPAGRVQVRFTALGGKVMAELRPCASHAPSAVEEPAREEPEEPEETLQLVDTFDRSGEMAPAQAPIVVAPVQKIPRQPPHPPPPATAVAASPSPLTVERAPPGRADAMRRLLDLCVSKGASDLHLTSGAPPALRIDGEVHPIQGFGTPSAEALAEMLWSIAPDRNREQWQATKDADFAHETGDGRFRVNLFCDRSGIAAVLRRIPGKVFSAEEMDIPRQLLELCFLSKGLILVTGPTGSGKSTTLAAMIDYVNRNRDDNIITIEDPIEFVHTPRRCQIHQREVGVHTASFKAALRAALREDPDIVLIGEMRDLETISIALETAETGHLVFGTLHTNTAPSTVDRIIDQFPADRQSQVRIMLSESLKAVVTQTLCKKNGGGRVAAREVLVANGAVSNLIREGKTYQLASVMQTGRAQGMQTLNEALLDLVRRKLISPEEALARAVAKADLRKALESAGMVQAAEA